MNAEYAKKIVEIRPSSKALVRVMEQNLADLQKEILEITSHVAEMNQNNMPNEEHKYVYMTGYLVGGLMRLNIAVDVALDTVKRIKEAV